MEDCSIYMPVHLPICALCMLSPLSQTFLLFTRASAGAQILESEGARQSRINLAEGERQQVRVGSNDWSRGCVPAAVVAGKMWA